MIYPLDSKLEPVIFRRHWDAINKDPDWQRDEGQRCIEEPWYWLINWVYTLRRDQFRPELPPVVERFPAKEYLRYNFDRCFRIAKLVEDKSRQMVMTWLFMAYELWWAQFHIHELIICQTKKEEDANEELVKRAHFMWKSQPGWMRPKASLTFCKLIFPQLQSQIMGIPSGPDQIRSHNPSRYLADECAFLEDFDDCRAAALACCGDIKLVSTANAGQFDDFVHDRRAA